MHGENKTKATLLGLFLFPACLTSSLFASSESSRRDSLRTSPLRWAMSLPSSLTVVCPNSRPTRRNPVRVRAGLQCEQRRTRRRAASARQLTSYVVRRESLVLALEHQAH